MSHAAKQFLSVSGLTLVTVFWGSTFILVKWSVASLDVYYFLFLRFLFASFLMTLLFWKRIRRCRLETIKNAALLGLLLAVGFMSQTEALRLTSATNVAMITGLYMVIIPISAAIFFKARASTSPILGAIISVIGLYMLTSYSYTGATKGDYIALICAFAYAWHIILTGRYAKSHSTISLVVFQFYFAALLAGAIAAINGKVTLEIQPIAWLTIFITSVFATVLAFLIQTTAQKYVDSTRVGIIFALESVFGALFAYWIGNEILTSAAFVGACLMVAGTTVSEIHPLVKGLVSKIVG